MATQIGTLVVEMSANVARLQKDMAEAKGHVNHAMEEIVRSTEMAKSALGAMGVGVAIAEFGQFMASALEAADRMGKLAQKAGVSTEELSRMSVAARLSDVDTQSLAAAMGKLDKNMIAAQDGTSKQAHAFQQLGISTTDAEGKLKSSAQIMSEVADKFSKTEDGAGKTAAAMEIFGKTGADLIPMLNGGSAELEKFAKLSDQLGLTLDGKTAQSAQDVNDRFQVMRMAVEGIGQTVMKDMLPTFTSLSEVMVDNATNAEMLHNIADALSFALKGVVSIGMGVVFTFKEVGNAIGGLAAAGAALADGNFKGAGVILSDMKTSFDKDAADMAATMDKLWAQHDAVQKKVEDTAKKDPLKFRADSGDQKVLEAAQKQDEAMLAMHEDTFSKQIEAWKKTEDRLIALGKFGAEARAQHEHAYTVFVEDESRKRVAAADAHRAQELAKENDYFARIAAQDAQYSGDKKSAEQKRFQDQIIEYQKRYEASVKDHDLTIEEKQRFEGALTEIQHIHSENRKKDATDMARFGMQIRDGEYQNAMETAAKMTAGLAQHSRAAFEVNKIAGIAVAVMNTAKGISGVLAEFPGPIGWGMAAAQAALGAAQVAAIESTQFGGGGRVSTPGGGGGVPSLATSPGVPVTATNPTAAQAPAAAPTTVNLTIAGANNPNAPQFTYNQIVNELIPLLNQAGANGMNINVMTA